MMKCVWRRHAMPTMPASMTPSRNERKCSYRTTAYRLSRSGTVSWRYRPHSSSIRFSGERAYANSASRSLPATVNSASAPATGWSPVACRRSAPAALTPTLRYAAPGWSPAATPAASIIMSAISDTRVSNGIGRGARRGLRLDSLAIRLMLLAVVLVVATAGLIGSLAYTRARRALEREADTRLAIIARDVAQSLDAEIVDRASDVTSWAHLGVMRAVMYDDVDKELAQFIRQIVGGGHAYVGISCVDARGRPVATAGDVGSIVTSSGTADDGAAQLPVRASIVAGADERSRLLQFETPIFDPERGEQPIGTLLVLVDPRRLLRAAETALGPAGTYLAFEVRLRDPQRTIVSLATHAGESAGDEPPADDASMLIGTAPVRHTLADGARLDVIVYEPVNVALGAVTALRAALLRRVSMVLLLGTALGGLVAWRIGVPIRCVTDTVREISDHDLAQPEWDFRSAAGEVGLLASAFRAMMERLAVARAEAVMQSRLALLGEIAANVAHEVRTPLSILKTSAQLLARRQLPPDEQRTLATNVAAEVDRLN